ncbi:hypothetical protein [Adhaeretor mobilis]|nr:hypothetical protein [Adhaeretor mobilis]
MLFASQSPPIDGKYYQKPAVAYVDADGTFESATSHKYKDGIAVGKHKILISASDAQGKLLIPSEYGNIDTTPLEIDAEESPFELKIRKPTAEERKNTKVEKSLY